MKTPSGPISNKYGTLFWAVIVVPQWAIKVILNTGTQPWDDFPQVLSELKSNQRCLRLSWGTYDASELNWCELNSGVTYIVSHTSFTDIQTGPFSESFKMPGICILSSTLHISFCLECLISGNEVEKKNLPLRCKTFSLSLYKTAQSFRFVKVVFLAKILALVHRTFLN